MQIPPEHERNTPTSVTIAGLNREKLIIGTGMVWMSAQLFVLITRALAVGIQYINPLTPLSIVFTIGILILLRRKFFPENLAASLLLFNISVWLGYIVFQSAGFHGPAVYTLIVIPVFAFLLVDSRAGWVTFIVTSIFLGFVAYLNTSGFDFKRPPVKGDALFFARAISSIIVMLLVSWIAWFYSRLHQEYQSKMEEKNRELALISQYKSDFIASMSHELRTPLNSIIGFSQRLSTKYSDTIDNKGISALEAINRNGLHLLTLINDVLDAAQIEAGKLSLAKDAYEIFTIVDLAVLDMKILAEEKNIALTLNIDDALKDTVVLLDGKRMRQIFSNLISNAIKYTPEGAITVTAELRSDQIIAISVTDTGCGIPQHDIEDLFTHFKRLKEHENSNIAGTGLGLAIVKQLVDMHGGSIEAKSEVGKGSCFTVCFPAVSKVNRKLM